jgi:hypothetical protein
MSKTRYFIGAVAAILTAAGCARHDTPPSQLPPLPNPSEVPAPAPTNPANPETPSNPNPAPAPGSQPNSGASGS